MEEQHLHSEDANKKQDGVVADSDKGASISAVILPLIDVSRDGGDEGLVDVPANDASREEGDKGRSSSIVLQQDPLPLQDEAEKEGDKAKGMGKRKMKKQASKEKVVEKQKEKVLAVFNEQNTGLKVTLKLRSQREKRPVGSVKSPFHPRFIKPDGSRTQDQIAMAKYVFKSDMDDL